jgi:Flp pilus assembly protein TadD
MRAELDGQHATAAQYYRQIIGFDPTNLHAINHLGAVSGKMGDLATAPRLFADSLRIDPNQPEAWFNLGIARSRWTPTMPTPGSAWPC